MNTKKLLALILAFTVILCAVPVVYADITIEPGEGKPVVPESGDIAVDTDDLPAPDTGNECGNGLTWNLTGNVLTISAADGSEGTMTNYTADNPAPWSESAASITTVEIAEGVTTIGDYAFAGCTGLTAATIPTTVTEIGDSAFSDCIGLASVTYGGTSVYWKKVTLGTDNSYLEAAAKSYEIKAGDVNGDETINRRDAIFTLQYIAGTIDSIDVMRMDVNGDNAVNKRDVIFILQIFAGTLVVE